MKSKWIFLIFLFIFINFLFAQNLVINDITVSEGNQRAGRDAVFTVTRSGDLSKTSIVKFATANLTALATKDYEAATGQLVFDPSVATQIITVRIYGDEIDEVDEKFKVTLSTPFNATITDATGECIIQDDDDPPTISSNDCTIKEANAAVTANIEVFLSQESSKAITLQYQTENITAKSVEDYTAKSGTLTIAAGTKSALIPISIIGDTVAEPEESFKVKMFNATNAVVIDDEAICTIVNDDFTMAGITIDDAEIEEGNAGKKELVFTVSLVAEIEQSCTVYYATADGTAKIGDYQSTTGRIVFEPGRETSKTISVIIYGDTIRESDENFLVKLSSPINAKILKVSATGTILNDDEQPQISICDVTVNEPANGATTTANFLVKLSSPSYEIITVKYTTADGTASSLTNDYTKLSGTLTFAVGVAFANINVVVKGDLVNETNETFYVNLSDEISATIAKGKGTCIIKGNTPPNMSILGKNQLIQDGDTEPTTTDDTDFSACNIDNATVTHTFTITNTGTGTLNLNGDPIVSISGTHAADFSVTAQPSAAIGPDGTTTFNVQFNPSAAGLRQAVINIINNSTEKNPYNFAIQGTGQISDMQVEGNSRIIDDGDMTPGLNDHTDFETANISSGSVLRTFTIRNNGVVDLKLTGDPIVNIVGMNSGNFTVTTQPAATIPSTQTTTFVVKMTPSIFGNLEAEIVIENNDPNKNPYNFAIKGNGTNAGSLDMAFGISGSVTTPITNSNNDVGYALALQNDSKIVVVGSTYNGSNDDFAIVRYSNTGALDFDFGNAGKVITAFGNAKDVAYTVAIQSDGKILVAGSSSNGTDDDFALVRYTDTGIIDTSFGTNGKVRTAVGTKNDVARAMIIQPDRKIIVVGGTYNEENNWDIALVRYTSTGFLDPTFGINGIVTTTVGEGDEQAYAVSLQSDGKIVIGGYTYNGSNNDFVTARYIDTGTLDAGFGDAGIAKTAIGSGNEQAYGVLAQADGKVLAVGYSNNGTNDDFALVRYTSTGELDTSFDSDGKLTTQFGTGNDAIYCVIPQSDRKFVVAGHSQNSESDYEVALARYTNSGTLDNAFGNAGKVSTQVGSGDAKAAAMVLQSDGKILVAGFSNNGNDDDFSVIRYHGDNTTILFASEDNRTIQLTWKQLPNLSATEYNLYRSTSENGEYVRINSTSIIAKTFNSEDSSDAEYTFYDVNADVQKIWYYKLEAVFQDETTQLFPAAKLKK